MLIDQDFDITTLKIEDGEVFYVERFKRERFERFGDIWYFWLCRKEAAPQLYFVDSWCIERWYEGIKTLSVTVSTE